MGLDTTGDGHIRIAQSDLECGMVDGGDGRAALHLHLVGFGGLGETGLTSHVDSGCAGNFASQRSTGENGIHGIHAALFPDTAFLSQCL